jgi:L-threonylcarbamoyladenylate synthase
MKTLRLQVSSNPSLEDPAIQTAAEIIRKGGLVAFPTETVYGLGANAFQRDAVVSIFEAKQRPSWDPIIVHCDGLEMLRSLVEMWPEKAEQLSKSFMPGPLTLLLPKKDSIPAECTAGRDKVGVRIPGHPVARALITAAGVPIAAPSANRFGGTSPTDADHVLRDLYGAIDAVLDAGPCDVGVESTVMDPSLEPPTIYRPGGISREQIEAIIGPVVLAQSTITTDAPHESLESPGLASRHYAPRAILKLAYGEDDLLDLASDALARHQRVGIMMPAGWDSRGSMSRDIVIYRWGQIEDHEGLARRLYQGLRWLDQQNVHTILCPVPKPQGLGLAIYDRLIRASTEQP